MGEGAERIIRRILDDARDRAESIKADAEKKGEAIEAEAIEKGERKKEQLLAQARKEAEEQKRRIIGVAQLEARKEMLTAKQDLLKEAFEKSMVELAGMEDEAYLKIIRGMLLKLAETGSESVIFSPRDINRITDSFLKEVNEALLEQGKKGILKLSEETREISGGFILQAEGIEINGSFDALMEMNRDDLEPEVAAILFA